MPREKYDSRGVRVIRCVSELRFQALEAWQDRRALLDVFVAQLYLKVS